MCPVKHGAGAATPVPSIPVAPAAGTGAPAAGVCPIRHAPPAPAAAAAPAAVCPVKHGKGDAAKPAAAGGAVVAIESVSEAVEGARPSATDTSVGSHQRPYGPPDSADRFVHPFERAAAAAARDKQDFPGIEDPSLVLGGRIPATGRGNSEDGSEWVMPSVGQLVRALRRNQKDVEEGDATSVAFVHGVVVGETWVCCPCVRPHFPAVHRKHGEPPALPTPHPRSRPSVPPPPRRRTRSASTRHCTRASARSRGCRHSRASTGSTRSSRGSQKS